MRTKAMRAAASAKDAANPAWDARQALNSVHIGAWSEAGLVRSDLLREIFNPFLADAPSIFSPTTTILSLARAIYEDEAFDRLPILADALEEAGCSSVEILVHCRGSGPHVRGCFVIDLMLGKE